MSEFGFRELLPPVQQQPLKLLPAEQELQPLASATPPPTAASSVDPGHLGSACGGYQTARAQALAHCKGSSSGNLNGSNSSGALSGDGGGPAGQAAPLPQPASLQPEQPSAWQRWFGASQNKADEEQQLLLPVPMRTRQVWPADQ